MQEVILPSTRPIRQCQLSSFPCPHQLTDNTLSWPNASSSALFENRTEKETCKCICVFSLHFALALSVLQLFLIIIHSKNNFPDIYPPHAALITQPALCCRAVWQLAPELIGAAPPGSVCGARYPPPPC